LAVFHFGVCSQTIQNIYTFGWWQYKSQHVSKYCVQF
jgi:hypothetical protein